MIKESINISNSVTHIENEVFWGCKSLKEITIPNNVKIQHNGMGEGAFKGYNGIVIYRGGRYDNINGWSGLYDMSN